MLLGLLPKQRDHAILPFENFLSDPTLSKRGEIKVGNTKERVDY